MRDRDLVALHWPPPLRPALAALLALDDRLADVALGAREPALGAIKLAWWRDQLAALDTQPPPPEPVLSQVAADLQPRGLNGADLSELAEAWSALLDEAPDPALRGHALFVLLGRLLGQSVNGGEAFARADLARRTGEKEWLRPVPASAPAPSAARPVTLLDVLGRRDVVRPWPPEPEATPGRSWALIRHRLTGR